MKRVLVFLFFMAVAVSSVPALNFWVNGKYEATIPLLDVNDAIEPGATTSIGYGYLGLGHQFIEKFLYASAEVRYLYPIDPTGLTDNLELDAHASLNLADVAKVNLGLISDSASTKLPTQIDLSISLSGIEPGYHYQSDNYNWIFVNYNNYLSGILLNAFLNYITANQRVKLGLGIDYTLGIVDNVSLNIYDKMNYLFGTKSSDNIYSYLYAEAGAELRIRIPVSTDLSFMLYGGLGVNDSVTMNSDSGDSSSIINVNYHGGLSANIKIPDSAFAIPDGPAPDPDPVYDEPDPEYLE